MSKAKRRKQDYRLPKLPDELGNRIEEYKKSLEAEPSFQKAFEAVVRKGLATLGFPVDDAKSVAA